jgi:hypothetical protein
MSGDGSPEEGRVEIADITGEFHAVERIKILLANSSAPEARGILAGAEA